MRRQRGGAERVSSVERQQPEHGMTKTGFCVLLTVIFVALKLFGAIHWTWLWVLSPIWIPLAILVFIALVIFALAYG